jgi:hypothetical protein
MRSGNNHATPTPPANRHSLSARPRAATRASSTTHRIHAAPLAFGYGAHYCLGSALAPLEIAVALNRIGARNPALTAQVVSRRSLGHHRLVQGYLLTCPCDSGETGR